MPSQTVETGLRDSEPHVLRWIVRRWSSLPKGREGTESPSMALPNGSVKLVVYPGGKYADGHVSLYAHVRAELFSLTLKVGKSESTWTMLRGNEIRKTGAGLREFIPHHRLPDVVIDDSITFVAQVTLHEPVGTWEPKPTLHADLRRLVGRGDMEIIARGVSVRAHKTILQARSALTFEEDEDEIPLDVDPAPFAKLVEFLYTDEIDPGFLKGNARALLAQADMFGVVRLKHLAENALVATIDTPTAADLLLFADAHSCALLREQAANFINHNVSAVRNTKGWGNLKLSPALLDDILEHISAPNKRLCVADLRRNCEAYGLDTDGTRKTLEARLRASKQQQPEPPPPAAAAA
ncbi:hypothetical protein CTAYLR_000555 [Chrysophaeum taylorii]|uniref:BTB domain-containing protein n=1 Tax=Chrysophaeum taylorii TaxID=2483200 RepID=A0AAD7UIT3_9STRA|nr:hypothetical protein CTAYLR_000555 [Chrysophaeum taylorii]